MWVIFKDSLQTFGGGIIDSVLLIVIIILDGAQSFKKPSDNFSSDLTSNVVFSVDTFISSDFVLSGKRLPKLNGLNAVIFIFGVFNNGL